MYSEGHGVAQDYAEAVNWYRKAADHGYPVAQLNLGLMYATGKGVQRNYVESYKWFVLATASYPALDEGMRKEAIRYRELAEINMTPAEIAEARKLANDWRPK